MIRCLHCGAETSNGLALCETCRAGGSLYLEYLPVYFRNLARWKPGRAGTRQVPGSRVLYEGDQAPRGDKVADALDEALTALTTWARALVKDRPHLPRPLTASDAVLCGDVSTAFADELVDDAARRVALLCAGFEEHLTSISTLDWAGEFVRDLGWHERRLQALTMDVVPGWYAGACQQCGTNTYVVPGLSWVTCRGCGVTTYARDHLEVILTEARGWVARPKALAGAIVALVDTELSVARLHERIRKWEQREKITGIWRTQRDHVFDAETEDIVVKRVQVGYPRYRMGEVLDRVLTEGETRTNGDTAAAS